MTESPVRAAERKRAARQADARRRAVLALQLGEQLCGYARARLASGLSPQEARELALETAAELEALSAQMRRLTRPPGPQRRALARQLAARGVGTREIAWQLGVDPRCVRYYVHGRDYRRAP